tara:strand:+ start:543 stop:1430 length:888 start_codon:yes stop_codon:yes gene_type:complete
MINFSQSSEITIVYKVENIPITNTDIVKEINYLILLNEELKNIDKEELVKYATKSIIREKVKKNNLIKKFQFGENNQIIEQQLSNLITELDSNDSQFEEILKQIGISKNYIKEKIEIEYLWNKLIYTTYKDKVKINLKEIEEKLQIELNNPSNLINEFLLYEILFTVPDKTNVENEILKIKNSITKIGFENTANILSESSSSKNGGRIGWVKENQLSKQISSEVKNLKAEEYTNPINVPGGLLILYLKEKRETVPNFSFEEELQKTIQMERDKQLNQFSSIYYKKIELNTKIYDL